MEERNILEIQRFAEEEEIRSLAEDKKTKIDWKRRKEKKAEEHAERLETERLAQINMNQIRNGNFHSM